MRTSIPQILEEVEKQTTNESKIKVLRSYDHPVLRGILQLNFIPSIKMDLPLGEPPFKKDTTVPEGYSESNLFVEHRRFYIWLDPTKNINKFRKESLFIQMLEGLHWKEAELVCLAKDKKIDTKYKTVTWDLVNDAFPNLLPADSKKEKEKEKKVTSPKKSKVPLKD